MLKLYILLYKLTGFCPSFLQLRIHQYAIRRLKRLSTPGYYISNPSKSLEYWIGWYECRIGLSRPQEGILGYLKLYVRYLGVLWKTMNL